MAKTVSIKHSRSLVVRLRTFRVDGMCIASRTLVLCALAWVAASTIRNYPHQLAYFNEVAGGASNGHKHLLHSSLDWGQDLLLAAQWQREHPSESQTFHLLRSSYAPRALGICGVDLRQANWCDMLAEAVRSQEVTILLSRQVMLEEDCFLEFDVRTIDDIGMSTVALAVHPGARPRKLQEQ